MNNNFEKAIIERIITIRNKFYGSRGKSKFARALGISASTYNYYEKDRVPPIEILLKICEVTGIDINWLLKGEKSEKSFAIEKNNLQLNKFEVLINENPEIKQAVEAFVEILSKSKEIQSNIRSKQKKETTKPGWIPVLGRTAAGFIHTWDDSFAPEHGTAVTELDNLVKKHIGKDLVDSINTNLSIDLKSRDLIDSRNSKQAELIQVCGELPQEIVEFVNCEQIHRLFPDSFALRVDGDSMSPRIKDGDIVILSPSVCAEQGQLCVACIANQIGVTCKIFRADKTDIHLIPINELYKTKVIDKKDLIWALAVLCHISF